MAAHRSPISLIPPLSLLPLLSLLAAATAFTPHNLTTPWTSQVDPLAPWPQHPRPRLYRPAWQSLNGPWNYTVTGAGRSEEGVITVPYCMESLLSGVNHGIEEGETLTYSRLVTVPPSWLGGWLLVHFEAVDHEAEVWVDGQVKARHLGGYDAFSLHLPADREQFLLTLHVKDPTTQKANPVGKQADHNSDGHRSIYYTPCSGVWQTIWMETVPRACHVEATSVTADIDAGRLGVVVEMDVQQENHPCSFNSYKLSIFDDGQLIRETEGEIDSDVFEMSVPVPMENMTLWSPDSPQLYQYTLQILDVDQGEESTVDSISGYFGMRKIEMRKVGKFERFFLNNELLPFQLGLLDQGYWPDGIYTPPTEEAMLWDLQKTKELGFNMVRKHVKVESERWYLATDTLGLLVWQDFPAISDLYNDQIEQMPEAQQQFEVEWREWVREKYNHPSIIMWVVFNEGWGEHLAAEVTEAVMEADPSRLVDGASGWNDVGAGHLRDYHVYPGPCYWVLGCFPSSPGRITVMGELWGRRSVVPGHNWFGDQWPALGLQPAEFLEEYSLTLAQLAVLHSSHGYSAAVFTQTTDVEGELNGFFTYDRRAAKVAGEEVRRRNDNFMRNVTGDKDDRAILR